MPGWGLDTADVRSPSLTWIGLSSLLSLAACGRPGATLDPDGQGSDAGTNTGTTTGADASTRDDEHVMAYGAQTIYVYAAPELDREVARLFALFEDLASEQVPLDGSTRLPIGWTTLSFSIEGERGERLVVQEPNYADQPETHTRPDISLSLATLARQRAVLEQAQVHGAAINFDQHVLVIRGSLELDQVFLLRVESPGGRLTGWRLSPTEGIAAGSETESLPVYAILAARPALLDAMLLPPGYMAFYEGDAITTIVNERDEVVWDRTLEATPLGTGLERTDDHSEPGGLLPRLEPLD
jgi:hypothetical protein